MSDLMNRRDLLKLAGMGVAVFVTGTTVRAGGSAQKKNESNDFYFVQLSDTHWGFNGPNINPDYFVDFPHTHQEHYAGDTVLSVEMAVSSIGGYISAGQPFGFEPRFPILIRS